MNIKFEHKDILESVSGTCLFKDCTITHPEKLKGKKCHIIELDFNDPVKKLNILDEDYNIVEAYDMELSINDN